MKVPERRGQTLRMVAFSATLGVVGGIAALVFDTLVQLAQHFFLGKFAETPPLSIEQALHLTTWPEVAHRWWLPAVTTLGGLLSGVLVYSLAPEAEGHGTDAVVKAYHRGGGYIRARIPWVKGLASAITIGSGGSAGREGPTAQIVAGLGASVGQLAKLPVTTRRQLLLIGTAAGLSAVFQSPLGAAVFAVEVLYSGVAFESGALLLAFIAAAVAYAVHGLFVGFQPIFVIPRDITFQQPAELSVFAALGIAAGMLGALLPIVFYGVRDAFHRIPLPNHVKPAIGGFLLGLLGLLLPEVLGGGYGVIQLVLDGAAGASLGLLCALALGKVVALSLTVGSGGSGGVFAPSLFVGALLGAASARVALAADVPANPTALAVVGMAAVFAAAGRVPMANLIMVTEMTGGYGLIVPTMLAVSLAYLTQALLTRRARYSTLYEAQVESASESHAHHEEYYRATASLLRRRQVRLEEDILRREFVEALARGLPIPLGSGNEELFTVKVAPGSQLDDTLLRDLRLDVVVVSVIRGQTERIPRGDTALRAGDTLVVAGHPEGIAAFRELSLAQPT